MFIICHNYIYISETKRKKMGFIYYFIKLIEISGEEK